MQFLVLCLLLAGGVTSTSSWYNLLQQIGVTSPPLPSIPKTTVLPTNVSCRTQPFSKCFLGQCPTGYTCLSSDTCCPNSDLNISSPDCYDYLEGCESLNCEARDVYQFALANCARTCNFCNEAPLAPQYNCKDLLPDCQQRASSGICSVTGFDVMMALYCPRSCVVCNYVNNTIPCGDLISNCSELGQDFCNNIKTSPFQLKSGCGKYCNQC